MTTLKAGTVVEVRPQGFVKGVLVTKGPKGDVGPIGDTTAADAAAAAAQTAAEQAQAAAESAVAPTEDFVASRIPAGGAITTALDARIASKASTDSVDEHTTLGEALAAKFSPGGTAGNAPLQTSASRSNPAAVACYGDSLTQGGQGGGQTWEQMLAAQTGLAFTNRGISGEESGTVAIRQGGIVLSATAGFTIPAGSTSPITVTVSTSALANHRNTGISLSIGGVAGTLIPSSSISAPAGPVTFQTGISGGSAVTWTFTPAAAPASAVTIAAGTPFVSPTAGVDKTATQIMWVGRNDIAFGYPYIVDGTLAAVAGMATYLASAVDVPRFLVLSCLKTAQYDLPAQGGNAANTALIDAINAGFRVAYPTRYVDLQSYLVTNATAIAAAAGVTLTSDDTAAIAAGYVPTSFTVDGLHLTPAVRQYGVVPCLAAALAQIRQGQPATLPPWQQITLQNSWTAVAGLGLEVSKKNDVVYLRGQLTGGTVTEGTVLANVPSGYRPAKTLRKPITTNNGGDFVPTASTVSINSGGDIALGANVRNQRLYIDVSYPTW